MRNLISGLTASFTALLLGMVIAGAADAARAADAAKQQVAAEAVAVDPADQVITDANAYRAHLQEAMTRLQQAYAELSARDAAYRDLLAASEANVAKLQSSNQSLQRQLTDAARRIQRAEAQIQAAEAATAQRRERRDDDD